MYIDKEVSTEAGRPGQGTFVQATPEQVTLPELTRLRRSRDRGTQPSGVTR
jgi:hypothetical protein